MTVGWGEWSGCSIRDGHLSVCGGPTGWAALVGGKEDKGGLSQEDGGSERIKQLYQNRQRAMDILRCMAMGIKVGGLLFRSRSLSS